MFQNNFETISWCTFIYILLINDKGYWGNGGNGTFTQFPINPLYPQLIYTLTTGVQLEYSCDCFTVQPNQSPINFLYS